MGNPEPTVQEQVAEPTYLVAIGDSTHQLTKAQATQLLANLETLLFKQSVNPISQIKSLVARQFGIHQKSLEGKSGKHASIVRARWIAISLCRHFGYTLDEIAKNFGYTDHAAVIYALATLDDRAQLYPVLRKEINFLIKYLEDAGFKAVPVPPSRSRKQTAS